MMAQEIVTSIQEGFKLNPFCWTTTDSQVSEG